MRKFAGREIAAAVSLLLCMAMVAGCAPLTPPAPESWDSRTAAFLWWTIEPQKPYPVIHLPTGIVSVYEESGAVLALSRLTTSGVTDEQRAKFIRDVLSARDAVTGLLSDQPPVAGPTATWLALQALAAIDREDAVDPAWQKRLLATVDKVLREPTSAADIYARANYFSIAGFLVLHGDHDVSTAASRALAASPAGTNCAATGDDISQWSAETDIAALAGARCTLTAAQDALVLQRAQRLLETTRRDRDFSVDVLQSLRAAQRLHASQGAPPGPLADTLRTLKAELRGALAAGRVDTRPAPLAIASEVVEAADGDTLSPDVQRLLKDVLRWGSQFTTFSPSVPLFLYVARSLLLLDHSTATRQRLAAFVDWAQVTGADRLELATFLDPARIDDVVVSDAVRHLPPAASDSDVWPRLAMGATIARAVLLRTGLCTPDVRDWIMGELPRLARIRVTFANATAPQLVAADTLVGLSEKCSSNTSTLATDLRAQIRRAASDQLAATLADDETADPKSVGPVQVLLELSCRAGDKLPDLLASRVSAVLTAAVPQPDAIGVVDETGRFVPEDTYSYIRTREILSTRCAGPLT